MKPRMLRPPLAPCTVQSGRRPRTPLRIWLILLSFLVTGQATRAAGDAARPVPWNFIVVLADDLGATDLGCMGSPFYETPHLDRLAADGLKFTAAYSACTVCSPTRASLLTGQYPARLHITDWIAGHQRPHAPLRVPDWTMHLSRELMNLGRRFHEAGYATASIGKWHLGGPEYYPDRQGFDVNVAGTDRGQPPRYVSPYGIATLPDGPAGEFLTDREAAEAARFIRAHRDRPFLVYLPHHAVHTPLAGKPEVVARYARKARPGTPQRNPTYAALIESVDDSIGTLRRTLDELHLADRTVIVFTSDNGGLLGGAANPITANLGLRAGKGSAYEGGVRVPLIVHWPGVTRPGSTSAVPVITPDLYPTLLEIAGLAGPPGHVVDGESLVPLLRGGSGLRRERIFWHYPHYHPGGATPYGAVREGAWKLIEFYEDRRLELYDLSQDPLEMDNRAAAEPGRARRLQRALDAWRTRVGAQMPAPNPNSDPARDAAR
jgi:arylsulfatase A-like enzyme